MRTEGQTDEHVETNSCFSQLYQLTRIQPMYSWMFVLFWNENLFREF